MDLTSMTLGALVSHQNETVRRNAMSILKQLQRSGETVSVDDAQHPLRQKAIRIIENCIEPILRPQRGVNGEQYYDLEDSIVKELQK